MGFEDPVAELSALLARLRKERGISRRQLADHAGVHHSIACRAERGRDAQLATWGKLFEALGYRLLWKTTELAEEIPDFLADEADRRHERRLDGLRARCWR